MAIPSPSSGEFTRIELAPGRALYVHPCRRFKTVNLFAVLHRELGPEAAALALLPMVLRRGTRRHPTLQALTRHLESLYGAVLDADVMKRGEHHVMVFRLVVPAPALVEEGEGILEEAFRFLSDLLDDPCLAGNAFPADVVDQEKTNLRHAIESLVDHRDLYALEALVRAMFRDERYAVYEYGDAADLDGIDPAGLLAFWRGVRRRSPLTLFAVGDVDPDRLRDLAARRFGAASGPLEVPRPTERRPAPKVPREAAEPFPLEQEWIVQGYRIQADLPVADYAPLLFFNGILGGFVFSRLFRRVREEEGLAYDIGTHADRLKGALFVTAGVQPGSGDRVVERIAALLHDLRTEGPTAEEMESSRVRLLTEIRGVTDSAEALVFAALDGVLEGGPISCAEMEARVERVRADDVIRLARSAALDTTFRLVPRPGGPAGRGVSGDR